MSSDPRSPKLLAEKSRRLKATTHLSEGAADVAPGYIISTEFSIKNAITYSQFDKAVAKNGDETLTSKREIKDRDIYEKASKTVTKAHYTAERLTAPYFNCLKFVDSFELSAFDEALGPCRETAAHCNKALKLRKSAMEVRIEIYKFPIDTSDRRNSIRLAQFIHESLMNLRSVYTDKRKNAYAIYRNNVINLQNVVVGPQRELIELAITATENQRPSMIFNYGGKKGTLDLKVKPGKDAVLNYESIDAAIEVFSDSLRYS